MKENEGNKCKLGHGMENTIIRKDGSFECKRCGAIDRHFDMKSDEGNAVEEIRQKIANKFSEIYEYISVPEITKLLAEMGEDGLIWE